MAKRLIISLLALGIAVPVADAAAVAPSGAGSTVPLPEANMVQLAQQGPAQGVPRVGGPRGPRVGAPGGPPRGPGGPRVGGPGGPGVPRVLPGRPGGPPIVGRPGFGGRPVVGGPVFVRPYRPFYRRPWFGTVIGGIALGTLLTAATVGVAPPYPPAPGLCWYWADPSLTQGYWDYCTPPY